MYVFIHKVNLTCDWITKETHICSLMQITTCNYVFPATIRKEKSKILMDVKSVWMSLIHLLQPCRWFHELWMVCFLSFVSTLSLMNRAIGFTHWGLGKRGQGVCLTGKGRIFPWCHASSSHKALPLPPQQKSFRIHFITFPLKLQNSFPTTVMILKVVSSLSFKTGQGTCSWKSPASRV